MSIYFYKNYFDFCISVCFVGFESNKIAGGRAKPPLQMLRIYII